MTAPEKRQQTAQDLKSIRNKGKNDRRPSYFALLDHLGYNETIPSVQVDALLIKAIREHFDISPSADIVLMALGLLKGYDYQEMSLYERRKKYLRESNYLRTNLRSQIKNFDEATEEEQKNEIKNIRKGGEDKPIESLAEFLIKQNITEYIQNLDGYITNSKNPVAILPEPSYNLLDSTNNAGPDFTVTDSKTVPDSEDTDSNSESHDSYNFNSAHSKNDIHVHVNIINNASSQSGSSSIFQGNNPDGGGHTREKTARRKDRKGIGGPAVAAIIFALLLLLVPYDDWIPSTASEEILVSSDNIIIPSGGYYLVSPVFVSADAEVLEDMDYTYTSSNPDIVQALENGLLYAQGELADGESVSVEITIEGPDNVTKKITAVVEKLASDDTADDIPTVAYTIEHQVRLADSEDKTWGNSVDAKIGDTVELRIAYKNNDTIDQMNVMIKDILPEGLEYVPGSTILVNGNYENGRTVNEDDIISRGINIGGYGPGANAFIRFRAEVVDADLVYGRTALVSWAQGSVNKTAIQDYAKVIVQKN